MGPASSVASVPAVFPAVASVVTPIVTPIAPATHAMYRHGSRAGHGSGTNHRPADHAPASCSAWS